MEQLSGALNLVGAQTFVKGKNENICMMHNVARYSGCMVQKHRLTGCSLDPNTCYTGFLHSFHLSQLKLFTLYCKNELLGEPQT